MKPEFPGTKHCWSDPVRVKILSVLHPNITELAELPFLLLRPPAASGRIPSVFKRGGICKPCFISHAPRRRGAYTGAGQEFAGVGDLS